MAGLQEYFRRVVACVFLIATLQMLFPGKVVKQVLKLSCGLVLLLVVINPIAKINWESLALGMGKMLLLEQNYEGIDPEDKQALMEELIKESTRTYILDKAKSMNFTPKSLSVTVSAADGEPFPSGVAISGAYTQLQRMEMTKWIEANFAIPEKAQNWKWE